MIEDFMESFRGVVETLFCSANGLLKSDFHEAGLIRPTELELRCVESRDGKAVAVSRSAPYRPSQCRVALRALVYFAETYTQYASCLVRQNQRHTNARQQLWKISNLMGLVTAFSVPNARKRHG